MRSDKDTEVPARHLVDRALLVTRCRLDTVQGTAEDKLRLSKGRASWVVGHAANRLRAYGFIVRHGFAEGTPSTEILRLLERGEFDLALLGGGSRKLMGRWRLGRTARHVQRQAPCSVVLVNDATDSARGSVLVGDDGSKSAGEAVRALQEFADPTKCEVTVVSVVSPAEIARRATGSADPGSPRRYWGARVANR